MFSAKCLVLALSVVASVNALATPHAARNSVHHRSIAARVAEPRSANTLVAEVVARAPAGRKRCRPRPTGTSSSSAPAVTPDAPINAAPIPTSTTRSSSAASSSTRAPEPSSTRPASSSAPSPSPTSSKPPAPKPTKDNGGGGGGAPGGFLAGTQKGQGTFYDTGLGACGITNNDNDPIIAVSQLLFDTYPGYDGGNPNKNPICGKKIRASRDGKSITVSVVDRCVGCAMTDLDFSPTAFDALTNGNRGLGRVGIEWVWA